MSTWRRSAIRATAPARCTSSLGSPSGTLRGVRIVGWLIVVLASGCGPRIDGSAQDGSSAGESSGGGPMTDPFTTTPSFTTSSDTGSTGGESEPDVGPAEPCDPIVFADPELERVVREQLGVDEGFVLTTETVQPLTYVGAIGAPIQDLSGLECATALETVSFSQFAGRPLPNGITDLTPLVELPLLVGIRLDDHDVSELMPFPTLLRLELPGNPVGSIAELVGSDALRALVIRGSTTSDLSPAAQLPALQILEASDTPVSDIGVLAGSDVLRSLYVGGTTIADLSVVPDLPHLEQLHVDRTAVTDVSVLAGSNALRDLGIQSTQVSDITVVEDLPALEALWISDTPISDLTVLEGRLLEQLHAERILIDALPQGLAVRYVFLGENGLTDPTPMATWDPPDRVDLSNNEIDDLTPFFSMPWTDLDFCVAVDLTGNPLSAPDSAAVAQDLCDTLMIDLETDAHACNNPNCPPPPP